MFSSSFWSRKGNKAPPSAERSATNDTGVQPEASQAFPKSAYPTSLPSPDSPSPAQNAPELIAAAGPNPHDDAILQVEATLSQVDRLATTTGTQQPAHDAAVVQEPLYDPATGVQRGVFEAVACADHGLVRDEVWSHLARMRELQSEIAKMHMNMEGLGEGPGLISVDVDADIDIETVPTQEEEDAARRQREFERLPGKFNGRADNISAMMAKVRLSSLHLTSSSHTTAR